MRLSLETQSQTQWESWEFLKKWTTDYTHLDRKPKLKKESPKGKTVAGVKVTWDADVAWVEEDNNNAQPIKS